MAQLTPKQLVAIIKKLQGRVKHLESELEKAHAEVAAAAAAPVASPAAPVAAKAKPAPVSLSAAKSPLGNIGKPPAPPKAPAAPAQSEAETPAATAAPEPTARPSVGAPPAMPDAEPAAAITVTEPDAPAAAEEDLLPGGLTKCPKPTPTDPSWPIEFSKPQGHVLHPVNDPILVVPPDREVPTFERGEFLEHVLEGEDEQTADMMRKLYDKVMDCDPKEKRDIFGRMGSTYWTLVEGMSNRIGREDFSWPKRLFLRFGLIDPNMCEPELLKTVYHETSKPGDTGIYYLDEWLEAIYRMEFKYSDIDEMALDGAKPNKTPDGSTWVKYEMINVPQMHRMVVGARANLCPILTSDYCVPSRDNPVLIRPYIYENLKYLKPFDYTIYERRVKGEDIEVQPMVLILPGYGVKSACWEPWSPGKKKTGPRYMVCFFPPRSSVKTLIEAMSDYRWEYAKTEAMHYWLTEGLTGKFLALFSTKEQRQDMKRLFRDFYMHWVLNEPRRVPKLDKKMREWYFINIPYTDDVKAPLRQGGVFMKLVEREVKKREREAKEKEELERIKAEREARKAARKAKQEMQNA